jgi:hypothetical protein
MCAVMCLADTIYALVCLAALNKTRRHLEARLTSVDIWSLIKMLMQLIEKWFHVTWGDAKEC